MKSLTLSTIKVRINNPVWGKTSIFSSVGFLRAVKNYLA